jgi:hypothetical protein
LLEAAEVTNMQMVTPTPLLHGTPGRAT